MNHPIKILDCTLRDGGYVNDFNFGADVIQKIINNLSESNVDLIELGFLKSQKFNVNKTIYHNIRAIYESFHIPSNSSKFCLMVRPDWYDIGNLEEQYGPIEILRIAFHARDITKAIDYATRAMSMGYKVVLNPVNVCAYTQTELEIILNRCLNFKPFGLTIVDTFGALTLNKFRQLLDVFNRDLPESIYLGIHLHDNLNLAMGLASIFIDEIKDDRPVVIDSTLMGMGRPPGNLCTELITNYYNSLNTHKYNIDTINFCINDCIMPIRNSKSWGYHPAYAKTAFDLTHRDYAENLLKIFPSDYSRVYKLLTYLARDSKRISFHQSVLNRLQELKKKDAL